MDKISYSGSIYTSASEKCKIVFLFFFFFFFFLKSNSKIAIFDLLFTFLVTREKTQKFLQDINTYTYFAHPIDFFAFLILHKLRIDHVWFIFNVTPDVDSFSRHFGAINV